MKKILLIFVFIFMLFSLTFVNAADVIVLSSSSVKNETINSTPINTSFSNKTSNATITNATFERDILPQSNASKVYVGLYLLSLGKFDIATGGFTADFYLSLRCDKTCPPINFEFMNGRAASFEKISDFGNEKFYRIQANLNSPINLKKFPFDEQELQIVLEDKILTTDEIIFVSDEEQTAIDENIIFSGWKLGNLTTNISEHYYPIYDETYSQYKFNVPISKIAINSILKVFLPVIFIILIMLSSFVLDPDKITTRLGMVGSALVAAVMFHVSLANQIPAVSYLTFADKFMILTYFVLVLSFFFNVFLLELHERKMEDKVQRFHRATEFTMFIAVPLSYVLLFIFFLR